MSKGPVFCPKSAPEISGANAPEYSGAPENLGAPWNSKVPRTDILFISAIKLNVNQQNP